ncbi:MAG TPA: ABC transporter permease [Pyrinomonadaceae bacterium]|nr:ABC transporter permease [Pyrinomonadaceae bacterium]
MNISTLFRRVRALINRQHIDHALDEELRLHLELETEKNMKLGHTPDEAARLARISLGGIGNIKEEYRDVEMLRPLADTWQDLRYACRTLSRSRSFVFMATLMLAFGIGANTAIFSVVHTVLIRPLPYAGAERVVWLSNRNATLGINDAFLNPADILDFREQSQSFERIAAWGTLPLNLYGARSPERVEGIYVTPNFFRTLGVQPELGRDFAEVNEPEDSVIISHALWLRQFGGDQTVIGKTITFGLQPGPNASSVIVGVLPAATNFPARVDLFTMTEITDLDRGGSHNWRTIGLLKPGVTIEQAQAEINTLTQRQAELYPDTNKGWQVQIESLHAYLFGNSRAALLLLFSAVAIVLVIACANVANLQLGRIHVRRRELALRLALGAGRFRIVRQFLIENILLSVLGGTLGVFVAAVCLSVVRNMAPDSIPRLTESTLSVPAFCFALAISCLSTILFGLFPAFQASQLELNDALKNSHTRGTTPRRSNRVRRTLVVGQIALAMILLTGAGLVVKSFWRLQATDSGMKSEHLLTAGLSVSFADYPNGSPKRTQLFRQALETLSTLPGVTSVGAISHLPLGGRTMKLPFRIVGETNGTKAEERVADYRVVSPSFFETAGVELKKGRLFDDRERRDTPQVFVINEAFARTYLAGREPVGVRLDGDSQFVKGEIVGVIASIKHRSLELDAEPALYVSYQQSSTFPIMNFVVKTKTDPSSLIIPVQQKLQALDSRGVVFNVRPFDQFVADAVAPRRFNLWLFSAFGFLAALLAATGIYATMNFAVMQRNREIGIRVALGAQKTAVMKLILGEGAILVVAGLLIGFSASLALNQFMKSLLFAVSGTDPLVYFLMAMLVVCIALLASSVPARRAIRIDPIRTLRSD